MKWCTSTLITRHHMSPHTQAHTSLCLWPAWTVISPLDFRIRLRASAYSHQPSNYEILIIYVCFLFRSFRISITILVNGCNQVSAIFLDVKLKSSFGIRILLTSLTAYQLPISELKMKRHSRRSIYFWIWILWCWILWTQNGCVFSLSHLSIGIFFGWGIFSWIFPNPVWNRWKGSCYEASLIYRLVL